MTEIRAAGGVLWRPAADGRVEIAVLHRPHHDDWSLPKGKLDPGETDLEAAVREVGEETGCEVEVGAPLGEVRYEVPAGDGRVPKVVTYWAMRAGDGAFEPNHEIDALRWLPPEEAVSLLSYGHDRALVNRFLEVRATGDPALGGP